MATKTWKDKVGKRLMKHVAETTTRSTLTEVKANIAFHKETGTICVECMNIARKLGL